jgi:hypothetical protein
MGGDHSQKVKAPPITNDYGSKDCVNLPSSTTVSRFSPPTEKLVSVYSLTEMEKSLSVRKVKIPSKEWIDGMMKTERAGLLGYHGDSLDFMIYQDIIRLVIELILEIPIRSDFHFLASPLDPASKIQTKEELGQIFHTDLRHERILYNTTFPLNFTFLDNANRIGLNTIEAFTKNESVKPLGYKKRLIWFFQNLGIDEREIETLFTLAQKQLHGSMGIILQIFDRPDYLFSKKIAYPSYPNGFICKNVTVDEYFLNEAFVPPYPQEIRLLLNNKETLNPNNPLTFIRFVPGELPESISGYEDALRSKIIELKVDQMRKMKYRDELLQIWQDYITVP